MRQRAGYIFHGCVSWLARGRLVLVGGNSYRGRGWAPYVHTFVLTWLARGCLMVWEWTQGGNEPRR